MSKISLYIGNVSFKTKKGELKELFEKYGSGRVYDVRLMYDKGTGRPLGYGFIDMDEGPGKLAQKALNGKGFDTRELVVKVAERKLGEREVRRGG